MNGSERYQDALGHQHRRARRPQSSERLERSRVRRLGGVAGGVANFVGTSPRTLRLVWLLSLPVSGGLTGVAYLVLWAILPAAGTHTLADGS